MSKLKKVRVEEILEKQAVQQAEKEEAEKLRYFINIIIGIIILILPKKIFFFTYLTIYQNYTQ